MPREKRLIRPATLTSVGFRNELGIFLRLSAEQIHELSVMADSRDGFRATRQTMRFAERASISPDDARYVLRVAEFLYETCRESRLPVDDAVTELVDTAAALGIPDVSEKRSALGDLLAAKDGYESERYAEAQALATVAHFMSLEGTWDIRPVFNRETQEVVTTVPVLLLNLSWHDLSGTDHEAVVQLNEDEWDELREVVEQVEEKRQAIQKHFGDS